MFNEPVCVAIDTSRIFTDNESTKGFCGNDVVDRGNTINIFGNYSFIDTTPLTSGTLRYMYVFVGTPLHTDETSTVIQFQIWRPVASRNAKEMKLVFEQLEQIQGSSIGGMQTVSHMFFRFYNNGY